MPRLTGVEGGGVIVIVITLPHATRTSLPTTTMAEEREEREEERGEKGEKEEEEEEAEEEE